MQQYGKDLLPLDPLKNLSNAGSFNIYLENNTK